MESHTSKFPIDVPPTAPADRPDPVAAMIRRLEQRCTAAFLFLMLVIEFIFVLAVTLLKLTAILAGGGHPQ
jgi:hypothetical protein